MRITSPGLTASGARLLAEAIIAVDTPVRAAIWSRLSPGWTRYSQPGWAGMVSTWPTRNKSGFCSPLAWEMLAGETPYIWATNLTVSPGCTAYARNGPDVGAIALPWAAGALVPVDEAPLDVA